MELVEIVRRDFPEDPEAQEDILAAAGAPRLVVPCIGEKCLICLEAKNAASV